MIRPRLIDSDSVDITARLIHHRAVKTDGKSHSLLFFTFLLNGLFRTAPALADSCPAPSFAAARTSGAGATPQSVAVGDFNRDGKPDFAVANYGIGLSSCDGIPGSISVLLNQGGGSFGTPVNYSIGSLSCPSRPLAVVVGDFDNDGKPDLAVLGWISGLWVLAGLGDGTFAAPVNYGVEAKSMAAGDFNGDGKADLALAGSVLLGPGFLERHTYGTGTDSFAVTVGDFNGDGTLDLCVANNASDTLSVFLGNGDGTFQIAVNYDVGMTPRSIAAADLRGTGKPDLIVANYNSGNLSVLLNKGDGSFQPAVSYGAGASPISVASADFNSDGKPDIVVVNSGGGRSGGLSVLLGNGDGSLQAAISYAADVNLSAVTVSDFNGDGQPDVAAANVDLGAVTVLLNACVAGGPDLAIAQDRTNITVSWPFPSSGFVLESALGLVSTNWQPAAEVAATNNGRWEITAPANAEQRYFRLHAR